MNDIHDDFSNGTNTSSTHNNKEIVDDGLNDTEEAKEDTNNDSDNDNVNDIDYDPADNYLADNDPEYTNPEEEQNPKLRAIKSVKRNKGKKKKRSKR